MKSVCHLHNFLFSVESFSAADCSLAIYTSSSFGLSQVICNLSAHSFDWARGFWKKEGGFFWAVWMGGSFIACSPHFTTVQWHTTVSGRCFLQCTLPWWFVQRPEQDRASSVSERESSAGLWCCRNEPPTTAALCYNIEMWESRSKWGRTMFCFFFCVSARVLPLVHLFEDNGLSVKFVCRIRSLLYLGGDGKAQSRELPDLPDQADESVGVQDPQRSVRTAQLHHTGTGLETTESHNSSSYADRRMMRITHPLNGHSFHLNMKHHVDMSPTYVVISMNGSDVTCKHRDKCTISLVFLNPTWCLTSGQPDRTVHLLTSPQSAPAQMLWTLPADHQRNAGSLWTQTDQKAKPRQCAHSPPPVTKGELLNSYSLFLWLYYVPNIMFLYVINSWAKELWNLVYELSDPDYFVDNVGEVSADRWPRLFPRNSMAAALKVIPQA